MKKDYEFMRNSIINRIMAAYPDKGAHWATAQWERAVGNVGDATHEFSYRTAVVDALLEAEFGIVTPDEFKQEG